MSMIGNETFSVVEHVAPSIPTLDVSDSLVEDTVTTEETVKLIRQPLGNWGGPPSVPRLRAK